MSELFIPRKTLRIPPGHELEMAEKDYHTDMLAIQRWGRGLTNTRLILPDSTILTGDIQLYEGNNIAIDQNGNGFVITAAPPIPARTLAAYAHGAASARILQKARIDDPVVTRVDVYAQTAPSGVDASNCGNVRVAGSISGAVVIPLIPDGTQEWHIGPESTATVLAGERITAGATSPGYQALAVKFRVSATVTVLNADVLWGDTNGGGNFRSSQGRFGIATGVADGTPVADPDWITDGDGNECFVDMDISTTIANTYFLVEFPTTTGFTLSTGIDYFFVVTALNDRPADTQRIVDITNGGTASSDLGSGLRQSQLITSASDDTSHQFGTTSGTTHGAGAILTGNAARMSYDLYGSVIGAPLTGFVIIEETITGAPPATTGADINISVQC